MRIGQLARKCGVSTQKIIAYLRETESITSELNPNSKLDEKTCLSVTNYFGRALDEQADDNELSIDVIGEGSSEELTDDREIEKEDAEEPEEELALELSVPKENTLKDNPGESIETDQLMELLEAEESAVDLSNITLIKASKKELSGLKVLGKIDIEEPEPEVPEKTIEEASEIVEARKIRAQERQRREEEKEERRLKFKKRREKYEAQQLKQQKEKEEKRRKEAKKAQYEKQMKLAKANNKKVIVKNRKVSTAQVEELPLIEEERRKPRTWVGKFWRWLDAPSK